MRILLTGSSGQLGRAFLSSGTPLGKLITPIRMELDLAQPQTLRPALRAIDPELILNCAAYTDVNGAEAATAAAFAVNAEAPRVLAEEARRSGALLVHFSTDYVFSGEQQAPYGETDATGPLNAYGRSKLAGEKAIEQSGCRYLIFRTSWVYSAHGHNFVRTMLRLGRERDTLHVVDDQVGAPTSARQLAAAVTRIFLEQRAAGTALPGGLYHLTAAGSVSWCGFARRIFQSIGRGDARTTPEVLAVPSATFPSPARRPAHSRLSNAKFQSTFGFALGSWEPALDEVLAELQAGSTTEQGYARR